MPDSEMKNPRSSASRASSAVPLKQCITPRTRPGAGLAQDGERVVGRLARVDDDRQVELERRRATCAANTSRWTSFGAKS